MTRHIIADQFPYECSSCRRAVVPNSGGVYEKDGRYFCSLQCIYTYYEGERPAENDDLIP